MAKLTKAQVAQIRNLLENSFQSQIDISKVIGVTAKTIANLNVGKTYKVEGFDYPIRKEKRSEKQLTLPLITAKRARTINVQNELMNSVDKTIGEIAEEYGMSYSSVSRTNTGERNFDSSLHYPLRVTREHLGRMVKTAAAEGMNLVDIQNRFGVTHKQVKDYLRGVKSV